MPVAAFAGRWGWGYDGVDLYAVHDAVRRPGGAAALRRRRATRAGLGVVPRRRLQPPRPVRQLPRRVRPVLHRPARHPWGERSTSTAPGRDEVRAGSSSTTRCAGSATSTSTGCGSTPSTRCVDDSRAAPPGASCPTRSTSCRRALGRPLVADRRERPERPARWSTRRRARRPRHDRAVERRLPPRPARRADRREAGLLRRLRRGADVLARRSTARVPCTTAAARRSAGAHWGRPVDPARPPRPPVPRLPAEPRPGRQPRQGDRLAARSAPGGRPPAPRCCSPRRSRRCCSWARSGRASTPWQFFTDFDDPELGAAVRDGRRREFAAHGWAAEDVPDPQDPATCDARVLDWAELGKEPHARMLAWYRALVALRRTSPTCATTTCGGSAWARARPARRAPWGFLVLVEPGAGAGGVRGTRRRRRPPSPGRRPSRCPAVSWWLPTTWRSFET